MINERGGETLLSHSETQYSTSGGGGNALRSVPGPCAAQPP
jgi:hypothetical protein